MSTLNNQPQDFNLKPGTKVALVVSDYNTEITYALADSCQETLEKQGAEVSTIKAPGAFELPFVCQTLAKTGNYDAVIAIGCIIRGETSHYDHIADAVANGVMQVGLNTGVPCVFGVLTVENPEQAKDRIKGGKRGDKGVEVALATLMLLSDLSS